MIDPRYRSWLLSAASHVTLEAVRACHAKWPGFAWPRKPRNRVRFTEHEDGSATAVVSGT